VKAGVRVRKDVVTEEDHRRTGDPRRGRERHPASGRPTAGSIKEGEIRVPLTEEEARVKRRPVAKEEISVGKRKVQETEAVRDIVRREEARIEEKGAARVRDP
jgi:uncharacterized protein (TIGR02271 family)